MKAKIALLILLCGLGSVWAQTSTVTVNTTTKKTQPPVGTLALDGPANFFLTRGLGTPEAAVTASTGSLYLDQAGKLWLKTSGTGNTGWSDMSVGGVANPLLIPQTGIGNIPLLSVSGPDTDIVLEIRPKGDGYLKLGPDSYNWAGYSIGTEYIDFATTHQNSHGNYLEIYQGDIASGYVIGQTTYVSTQGTGAVNDLVGALGGDFEGYSSLPAGRTLSNATGVYALGGNYGAGMVTTAYAVDTYVSAFSGPITAAYGVHSVVGAFNSNTISSAYGMWSAIRTLSPTSGTGSAINFGADVSPIGVPVAGLVEYYGNDSTGKATNGYFLWYDGPSVFDVRANSTMDFYNPSFTKYTMGAANYERGVIQWNSNVLEIGTQAGGTGTLRPLRLLGDTTVGNLTITGTCVGCGGGGGGGTPGGSTKDIQWNNAGVFAGGGPQYDSTAITITNAGSVNGNLGNIVQNTNVGTGAQATFVSKNSTNQANYGITGTGLSPFTDLVANQAYLYSDSPNGIGLFANAGGAGILFAPGGLTGQVQIFPNQLKMISAEVFGWTSGNFSSPIDTALARNTAGTVEINNGTAGQYRDFKARQATFDMSDSNNNRYIRIHGTTGADAFFYNIVGFGAYSNNVIYNGGFNYDQTGTASQVLLANGEINLQTFPSGTSGTAVAGGGTWVLKPSGAMALPIVASAPASPVEGWLYGNSTDHKIYYHNGTSFVDLTAGGGGGGTIGGSIASPQVAYGSGANTITGDNKFTYSTSTGGLVGASDAATNTNLDVLTLDHQSSGAGAATFGTGILFDLKDSTTQSVGGGRFRTEWTTATHNSNVSRFVFSLTNGSTTLSDVVWINGAGQLQLGNGTASLPTLNYIGAASNTGIYWNSGITLTNAGGNIARFGSGTGNQLNISGNNGPQAGVSFVALDATTAPDSGIHRSGAGAVQIDNGGSGYGTLAVGAQDTTSNTVSTGLSIGHRLNSGTAATGMGSGISYKMVDASGGEQTATQINAVWSDPANATRSAYLDFTAVNNAVLGSRMRLTPSGSLNVGNANVATTYTTGGIVNCTALNFSGAAGTAGFFPQSDGTNGYLPSTYKLPTSPGAAGYSFASTGSAIVSKPVGMTNGSSAQQTGFASNTYLAGSVITVAAGDFTVGTQYHCKFDMTKTTAGTAAPVVTVYVGTNGTTADTAAQTITWAAATGVADTGIIDVMVNFRAVGASATIASVGTIGHNLAATGLTSTGAAGVGTISNTTSSTFNSTAATKIGIAFNGGASYVGTNNIVQADFHQP